MKRFISLFAVVALVVAMAVPAMAADEYTISGVWQIVENPVITNWSKVSVNGTATLYYGDSYEFVAVRIHNGDRFELTKPNNSGDIVLLQQHLGGCVFDFGDEPQVVSSAMYNWFVANSVPPTCDGSTCPATDDDHDDICDDCGLPMAFLLRDDTTYDYNGFVLPLLPNLDYDAYWVMFPSGDTAYRLVSASKPFSVENGEVYVYEPTSLVFFSAGHSSNEWSQYSTQNITTKYSVGDAESIVWASHNIANKETGDVVFNGDVNFRDPLWVEMEQVTQGGMTGLIQTMGGTMKTLVVCGVGLMACLVVLSLFGKRSLIFRS